MQGQNQVDKSIFEHEDDIKQLQKDCAEVIAKLAARKNAVNGLGPIQGFVINLKNECVATLADIKKQYSSKKSILGYAKTSFVLMASAVSYLAIMWVLGIAGIRLANNITTSIILQTAAYLIPASFIHHTLQQEFKTAFGITGKAKIAYAAYCALITLGIGYIVMSTPVTLLNICNMVWMQFMCQTMTEHVATKGSLKYKDKSFIRNSMIFTVKLHIVWAIWRVQLATVQYNFITKQLPRAAVWSYSLIKSIIYFAVRLLIMAITLPFKALFWVYSFIKPLIYFVGRLLIMAITVPLKALFFVLKQLCSMVVFVLQPEVYALKLLSNGIKTLYTLTSGALTPYLSPVGSYLSAHLFSPMSNVIMRIVSLATVPVSVTLKVLSFPLHLMKYLLTSISSITVGSINYISTNMQMLLQWIMKNKDGLSVLSSILLANAASRLITKMTTTQTNQSKDQRYGKYFNIVGKFINNTLAGNHYGQHLGREFTISLATTLLFWVIGSGSALQYGFGLTLAASVFAIAHRLTIQAISAVRMPLGLTAEQTKNDILLGFIKEVDALDLEYKDTLELGYKSDSTHWQKAPKLSQDFESADPEKRAQLNTQLRKIINHNDVLLQNYKELSQHTWPTSAAVHGI